MTNSSVNYIEILDNWKRELFFFSSISKPNNLLYYSSMPSLLRTVFKSSVTLKSLFNKRASCLAEISSKRRIAQ